MRWWVYTLVLNQASLYSPPPLPVRQKVSVEQYQVWIPSVSQMIGMSGGNVRVK